MPAFIKGLKLSRLFYVEAVCPLLEAEFSGLPYAAAKVGSGSDVLGFDSEMSRDHDWGPSVSLFLKSEDFHLAEEIRTCLAERLPLNFQGYSTHFVENEGDNTFSRKTRLMHPVHHRIDVLTVEAFCKKRLGVANAASLSVANWLAVPSQALLELTAGKVFHDDVGELTSLREGLAWYPHDIWLYMMASCWQHVAENQPLMSRAGFMNDELGSSLIASDLVQAIMLLCFLQERRYAPYPKWLGSAFERLDIASDLSPKLTKTLKAETWKSRETALNDCLLVVAEKHNILGVSKEVEFSFKPFFSRPFTVLVGDFVGSLVQEIHSANVKQLCEQGLVGNIDLLTNNTVIKANSNWQTQRIKLYRH